VEKRIVNILIIVAFILIPILAATRYYFNAPTIYTGKYSKYLIYNNVTY